MKREKPSFQASFRVLFRTLSRYEPLEPLEPLVFSKDIHPKI
jgi:hypothetical protein